MANGAAYERIHRRLGDADKLYEYQSHMSERKARVAWEDTLAGVIEESWADTTNWNLGSPGFVVSGGVVVAAGSPGAGSGGTRKLAVITPSETARIQFIFNQDQAGSGSCIFGVSKDADGGAPAAAAANVYGLQFVGNVIQQYVSGAATAITVPDANPANGQFLVTIEVDEAYISVVAVRTDNSTKEYRMRAARPAATNLIPYLYHAATSTTKSIGKWAMKKGPASGRKGFGLAALGRSVIYTQVGNAQMKIELPVGYDSRVPCPVIMAFHGAGSDENLLTDHAEQAKVGKAFVDAGFIVASARYAANGATWGAQESLDAYYALYQYLINHIAVGPIVFYANSMGGIESLLCIAEERIKGVVGWIGQATTVSLAANYADPAAAGFTSSINSAYGITGTSPNTYAEKTTGHDPSLMPASAFRGLPMAIYAASDDTTVLKALNGDVLAAKVADVSSDLANVAGITGGHSFALTNYAAPMLAQARKWVGI